MPPTVAQLRHAILRNFGGMQEFDPYLEFKKTIPRDLRSAELIRAEVSIFLDSIQLCVYTLTWS